MYCTRETSQRAVDWLRRGRFTAGIGTIMERAPISLVQRTRRRCVNDLLAPRLSPAPFPRLHANIRRAPRLRWCTLDRRTFCTTRLGNHPDDNYLYTDVSWIVFVWARGEARRSEVKALLTLGSVIQRPCPFSSPRLPYAAKPNNILMTSMRVRPQASPFRDFPK